MVLTITEAQNPGAQEVFLRELCNELQIRKCDSSFSMEKTVLEFMKTFKVGIFNLFMSNSFKETDTVPANGLCGYLAIFAINTESGLNLKNKLNRNRFINFYRDLKSKITDMQIIDKLTNVIDWVTTAYNKPKAKSEPFFFDTRVLAVSTRFGTFE